MKRLISTGFFVALASAALAQLSVIEGFYPPIQNVWDEFWTNTTSLTYTTPASEGMADRAGGTGHFLKCGLSSIVATSAGRVSGALTDTSYTLQAYLYIPVVNTAAGADAYWYQMLVF